MRAACNPGEVHAATADTVDSAPTTRPGAKFAALPDRNCRKHLGGSLLSMMADNVEQYISQCR